MKLAPLVLLATLPLASCVTKVGSPGSDVPAADRSLRMPEVGEKFDYVYLPGGASTVIRDVTVLRIEGRSVLVGGVWDEDAGQYESWIDWEDVMKTILRQ